MSDVDASKLTERDILIALNSSVAQLSVAVTTFSSAIEAFRTENAEAHHAILRDTGAKIDNLQRAVNGSSANMVTLIEANNKFLERLDKLLEDERAERRELMTLLRGDNKESLTRARNKQDQIEADVKGAAGVLWNAGGKYIVYAIAALVVYMLGSGRIPLP